MQPLRLVFVTSLVPHEDASTGYEVANAAVINGLRRAGAHVTVIGFTWPGRKAAADADVVVLGEVEVRTEGASATQKIGWVIKSFLTGLTVSSAKLRVIPPMKLHEAIAACGDFDAYVLNGVALPGAFEAVFHDKPSLLLRIMWNTARHAKTPKTPRALSRSFSSLAKPAFSSGLKSGFVTMQPSSSPLPRTMRQRLASPGKSRDLPAGHAVRAQISQTRY